MELNNPSFKTTSHIFAEPCHPPLPSLPVLQFLINESPLSSYLTIIPRARMDSESLAHVRSKTEWAVDSEAMRVRGVIIVVKFN